MTNPFTFEIIDHFAKCKHIASIPIKQFKLTERPLITIAIPTYKRAVLLNETIKSALNQTFKGLYEILVVDNNPERGDETEQLLCHYSNYPQISYWKNSENIGMMNNWNRLFLLAQSNWVVMLHDDDLIQQHYLATMVPYINEAYGYVACRQRILTSGCLNKPKKYKANPQPLSLIDYAWGNYINAPVGVMINKKKAIIIGGFDSNCFPTSDYYFFAFMTKSFPALMINEELGIYRVECNASFKTSTLDGFVLNDYQLTQAIMTICHIPAFIRNSVQTCRLNRHIKNLRRHWNPKYSTTVVSYSSNRIRYIFSYIILKLFYRNYVRLGKCLNWKYYCNPINK